MTEDETLIDRCRTESLELLRRNSTRGGILASSVSDRAVARGYDRVFARDAGICAIAMTLCGDRSLRAAARRSLLTLAKHQAPNGQVPKYVDSGGGGADFWYLGCIDATLWWLVALDFVGSHPEGAKLRERLAPCAARALAWLRCQEHQQLFLLQQNEASDWADIMPRSGFVLYTNALWYYVKRRYLIEKAEETRLHFNELFFPFRRTIPDYRRLRLLQHYVRNKAVNRELYLSFVNLGFWGEEGDVFGNLLAILFDLMPKSRATRVVNAIKAQGCEAPYPVRVTLTPITMDHPLWRTYMARHRQNLEWRYHNAGIWPFVGGFWVTALAARGELAHARRALAEIARANAVGNWGFVEWFHGRTGEPLGMPGQSWNAATFLLAHLALERQIFRSENGDSSRRASWRAAWAKE